MPKKIDSLMIMQCNHLKAGIKYNAMILISEGDSFYFTQRVIILFTRVPESIINVLTS